MQAGASKIREFLLARASLIKGYSAALSGSAGRLVFSLAYFVILANTLAIDEFGIFATASAAGVVISRLLAFGFISPLYRVSAVKPLLLGVYAAGFIFFAIISLPVVALAAVLAYAVFFAGELGPGTFAVIIASEALAWRCAEAIIIVNNGLGRFGRAAILVIAGTALRSLAALLFAVLTAGELAQWSWFYLGANGAAFALALLAFYPGHRLRLVPRLYWRRLVDSSAVSASEILFYLQTELDKLLVLSFGGATLAGIYAIVMRLVDLTAIPIRAFIMLLVQSAMRKPQLLDRKWVRGGIECGIFALSTLGLAFLAAVLAIFPDLLGQNIGEVAPILGFALFIPAFRNLIEYQAELLYARGRTVIRAGNLAVLAVAKGVLLWLLLRLHSEPDGILIWLNAVFGALYLLSFTLTYSSIRTVKKAI